LLPAETESIIFLNMKQVIESDLVKKYALGQVKQFLEGNDAQKMLKDLGIDPLKDIDRLTAGTWGKGPEDMQLVAVVRGKFSPEKLFEVAQREAKNNGDKLAIVEEGGVKMVKVTVDNQPRPFFVSVADEKTIIVATEKKLVVNAITAAQKGTKPTLKKELAQLMLSMDEKATMYAVGMVDGKIDGIPPGVNIPGVDGAKLAKQLEKLQNFTMTLRITDEVGVEIGMGMKDTDAADDFGDTVTQLIGTVKQFLPFIAMNQPNMKPIADEIGKSLKSKVKDKNVQLSIKLSADAIGKAAGGGD
jgi:hypothetical protein